MSTKKENENAAKFAEMLKREYHPTTKKRKKRAPSFVAFKRDHLGNRIYSSKQQKRRTKKTAKQTSETIPSCSYTQDDSHVESSDVLELQKLEESVKESLNFLKSQNSNFRKKQKSWSQRQNEKEEEWSENRGVAFRSFLDREVIANGCYKCHEKASIHCEDCEVMYCNKCDISIHTSQQLHNRKAFLDGFLSPISPREYLDDNGEVQIGVRCVPIVVSKCICCDVQTYDFEYIPCDETCAIITMKGRYELDKFMCKCNVCDSVFDPFNIATLISCGYWPSSFKSSSYIIAESVFQFWDFSRKRMPGSSEKSFLQSLNDLTDYYGRNGFIYPHPFDVVFREWSICKLKFDGIQKLNWFECPCCVIAQHSCHVDGNCKLYRYASSGRRRRKSFYGDLFIADDEDVKIYLKKIYGTKKNYKWQSDKVCGGVWAAARNVGKKKGTLDDTGLEVATCRHCVAQKAVNMKQGELFGYPLYIMKNFMTKWNVEYCWADVMCKLWKFVKREEPDICHTMKPALSVMHAKGHSLQCQVQWDGQWIDGTGRSTGEETEQFFSYISRCSNTTKYQLPERREETITEHAMHWNKNKILRLPQTLVKKFKRVSEDLASLNKNMSDLIVKFNITEENCITSLIKEIKMSAAVSNNLIKYDILTKYEQYALLLLELKSMKSSSLDQLPKNVAAVFENIVIKGFQDLKLVPGALRSKEMAIQKLTGENLNVQTLKEAINYILHFVVIPAIRSEIEKSFFEKTFWLTAVTKLGDKSKRRNILRMKVAKCKELTVNFIEMLESSGQKLDSDTKEKVLDGKFPWSETQLFGTISAPDKRLIVETFMRKCRSEEELDLLKRDMRSYLSFYRSKLNQLEDLEESENVDLPTKHLAKRGKQFAQSQLSRGIKLFAESFDIDVNVCSLEEVEEEEEEEEQQQQQEIAEKEFVGNENETNLRDEVDRNTVLSLARSIIPEFDISHCFREKAEFGEVFWFPSQLSQGVICGRNGSSACTVISCLAGYFAQFCGDDFLTRFLTFIGTMEIGNILYEESGSTEFLSILEGLEIVQDVIQVECIEESGCVINKNIVIPLEFGISTYFVLVGNGKSYSFYKEKDVVYFMDSHANLPYGACIYVVPEESFDTMIRNKFNGCYVNLAVLSC